MSTEEGSGERLSKEGTRTPPLGTTNLEQSGEQETQSTPSAPQQQEGGQSQTESLPSDQKPSPQSTQAPLSATASANESHTEEPTRQVIAVSASKGPAAFFNLARKFLATDEMCDLSALEGAIVSAVDAAHLLERSQLATIVRVNTSYVTVEPKRRKQTPKELEDDSVQTSPSAEAGTAPGGVRSGSVSSASPLPDSKPPAHPSPSQEQPSSRQGSGRSSGRELRRARIVITVRRTESYKRWLEENPLQAIMASEGDADVALENAPGIPASEPPE